MKKPKFLAILTVLSVFAPVFVASPADAAQSYSSPLGYIETVEGAKIKGWVYFKDTPVSINLVLQSLSDSSDYRNYEIGNQQSSNKISYFTQRSDVQSYLKTKYGSTSFSYPQGFFLTGTYLPNGQWKLIQATAHASSGAMSVLPITSDNKTMTVESSETYSEGYIDSTSDIISGWAFNNSILTSGIYPEYAPDINITVSKTGSNDVRTYSIDKHSMSTNVNGNGPIMFVRGGRSDVVNFLTSKRGQANNYFFTPESSSHENVGFQFHYKNVLSSGTWFIESITAGNDPVFYGNTNPSPIIYVP